MQQADRYCGASDPGALPGKTHIAPDEPTVPGDPVRGVSEIPPTASVAAAPAPGLLSKIDPVCLALVWAGIVNLGCLGVFIYVGYEACKRGN